MAHMRLMCIVPDGHAWPRPLARRSQRKLREIVSGLMAPYYDELERSPTEESICSCRYIKDGRLPRDQVEAAADREFGDWEVLAKRFCVERPGPEFPRAGRPTEAFERFWSQYREWISVWREFTSSKVQYVSSGLQWSSRPSADPNCTECRGTGIVFRTPLDDAFWEYWDFNTSESMQLMLSRLPVTIRHRFPFPDGVSRRKGSEFDRNTVSAATAREHALRRPAAIPGAMIDWHGQLRRDSYRAQEWVNAPGGSFEYWFEDALWPVEYLDLLSEASAKDLCVLIHCKI